MLLPDNNATDFDGLYGYVLIKAARGGFDAGDFGNGVHSAFYPAENGVAVLSVFVVERTVVRQIDKELGGGGIGVCRPRHCDGADGVFQAVAGFVGNGLIGCLLHQVLGQSAALDDEAADDAVENRVVVKAFSGIAHEIGNGLEALDSSKTKRILPISVSIRTRVAAIDGRETAKSSAVKTVLNLGFIPSS